MTNGPNEKSNDPSILDNPYPKGSARWKMKQRQLNEERKRTREAEAKKPKPKEDKSKRRKYLDEKIDG